MFSDPAALERLNAIVYEFLPPELMRRAAGQSLVGLDAINLVESGLDRLCACTVAVLAPAEDRVRRIMARDASAGTMPGCGYPPSRPTAFTGSTAPISWKTPAPVRRSSGIRHGFSSGKHSGKSNIFEEESEP